MRNIFLCILFFGLNCAQFENEQAVQDKFVGEWNWRQTVVAEPYVVIDADTSGYSMRLDVHASGEAEWFRDDSLMDHYKITFRDQEGGEGFYVLNVIKVNDGWNCPYAMQLDGAENLSLHMIDCEDGSSFLFEK